MERVSKALKHLMYLKSRITISYLLGQTYRKIYLLMKQHSKILHQPQGLGTDVASVRNLILSQDFIVSVEQELSSNLARHKMDKRGDKEYQRSQQKTYFPRQTLEIILFGIAQKDVFFSSRHNRKLSTSLFKKMKKFSLLSLVKQRNLVL